jgi:tRNA(Ile)-lysidine synthase
MHNHLIDFILKEKLIAKGERVILTVSGGRDSVLMCHLFAKTNYPFAIANCNFNLRGEESDGDSLFVENLAKQLSVPFFYKSFATRAYAKEHKISIQMAARDLRFDWFRELCEKEDYAVYATAHHADDAIETYFINQLRGTGIAGLHGLLPKKGNLIHPLLFTTRNEIDEYIEEHKLSYREDSSNASTKYLRNSLRHKVMPVLEDLQPTYRDILMQNMQRFSAVESIYLQKVEEEKQRIFSDDGAEIVISIRELVALSNTSTYLYEFLKEYGFSFSQAEEIVESMKTGQVGAQFYTTSHVLLRDRDNLILTEKSVQEKNSFELTLEEGKINSPIDLKWKVLYKAKFEIASELAFVDFDKLKFPLKLRKWEQGDAFYPLGMQGKKLLSDFFIDQKLNRFEKENTWLLLSGKKIVWVVGMRLDNRFKISSKTKRTLKVELKS